MFQKMMILSFEACKYTRASHNAASNSADLSIALMTKSSWKFLHSETWISADKKLAQH